MPDCYDDIGAMGLQFFGKVSASISHELKNVLAVLNENAGLLEDLSFAAQRGKAIGPEQIERICGNFAKQIHRADDIIKGMNRFAHSVDQFVAQVDLFELARLVATLAGRSAAMRCVTIEVVPPANPVGLETNPFLLQNLIWLWLEKAIASAVGGGGGVVRLAPVKEGKRAVLSISAPAAMSVGSVAQGRSSVLRLLAALQADLTTGDSPNEVRILLGG